MHSEIEATEPHEVRHVHFIDRGTMVSLLVSNHKLTGLRRVTFPTGRTVRAVYRYAVLDQSHSLQRKGNFEAQLVRRRPAARSEEHTSELQSHHDLVCRLLLEKKKT